MLLAEYEIASLVSFISREFITALRVFFQVSVPVPHFYTPVTNLLLPMSHEWKGMRTVGRLRFEMDLKPPVKTDSFYKVRILFLQSFSAIFFRFWRIIAMENLFHC